MYMQINVKFLTTVFICQKPLKHWSWSWREKGRERERIVIYSGHLGVDLFLYPPHCPFPSFLEYIAHCSLPVLCWVKHLFDKKNQTIQIVMRTFYVCIFKSYFISQMHFIQISNSSTVYILFVQFKNFYHIHGKISNKDFLCLLYNI